MLSVLVLFFFFQAQALGFSTSFKHVGSRKLGKISMHFEEAVMGNVDLAVGALPSQRYIACNRFKVRNGAGPKFEKRWADRKSRLAQLKGFRFFTLLRRVPLNQNTDYSKDGDFGNYVSFTIWEDKDCFDAWRTGDAFKEAHGGGGITDFIQLLTTAIFILDGGPKPAFYDALLPQKGSQEAESLLNLASEGGWRKVEADGENFLPSEVFFAQSRYSIPKESILSFEQSMSKMNTENSKEYDAFVGSFLQRRDASKADDGYNYLMTSIWKDQKSYEVFALATADGYAASPVSKVYYEGKLALMSDKGI